VANIDRLRYANGSVTTADLRLRMQKVNSVSVVCVASVRIFNFQSMYNVSCLSTDHAELCSCVPRWANTPGGL